MADLFEKTTRLHLRFSTARGLVTTEDLWDMPLSDAKGGFSLDAVAIALDKDLKAGGHASFVTKTTKPNEIIQLKFDVVKFVIDVKLAEAEAATAAAANKVKRERIKELLAKKQDAKMEAMTEDELKALLDGV